MREFSKAKRMVLVACLLFFAGFVSAQDNYSNIQTRFAQYRKKALPEKIYMHTDKNFYLAGEILWYKIYNVDGTIHEPVDLSKIAYVEILDKDHKQVMQAKIALKKGLGSGSFYLPSSINSGNYILRAYTNWMKNFSPEYYFEKPVTIVNSLKILGPRPADTAISFQVQFFPEGGNLVRNIESKVAFRVTDNAVKGINFSGALLTENNDTVLTFRPSKFGIGNFTFTPSANHTYRAIITPEKGQAITRDLPAIFEQGYVMKVNEETSGSLKVVVITNMPGGQDMYLFVHTRQSVKIAERHIFNNGVTSFTIDKNKLGDGISHFTVFNSQQQPVCERLYFKAPEHVLSISANTNATEFTSRKKVTLFVNTAAKTVTAANMSLAVYRLDSLQSMDQNSILSYLWLTSDLRGNIESPEYYFSGKSPEIDAATDNLMLVHGWRRFDWNEILLSNKVAFEYIPEYDGQIITAKITRTETGIPAPNTRTYLSVPGYKIQFYNAVSDDAGKLRFDVRDYYGQNEVILQTITKDSGYRIDISNPFSDKYSTKPLAPFNVSESVQHSLTDHSVGMQVQNTYSSEKMSQFDAPAIDTLPFYGKPYSRYLLDDYTRFGTMEEVLREYVPDVAIRRFGGQYHLLVFNWDIREFYQDDPLILLDGVPINNQKIMTYDPLKVKKLEVVTNRYINGEFTYEGIVSFTTYHGDLDELKLDPKTIVIDYDGLQLKREFYSPKYENEHDLASRIPDFRNLLYWSPDIQSDKTGHASVNFYTSDLKGKYVAVLQGIDESGNAGSFYFTFDVTGK